ncbi:MAG: hypothetical protein GY710_23245 [Desulfobacteraceae bacterium]|nr:hypothetical protein [Desulfobacteraceae bacterium]
MMQKMGRWRLIIPKLPEKYLNIVAQRIISLAEYKIPFELTINDYGFLYFLQNRKNLLQKNIRLGRGLVRSFSFAPWADYLLRDECKKVQTAFTYINMKDQVKLDYLKSLGVKGFEVSDYFALPAMAGFFEQAGFQLAVHQNSIFVSVGRQCAYARHYQLLPGQCGYLCNKVIHLQMHKRWNHRTALYETILVDQEKYNFYALENFIFRRGNSKINWDNLNVSQIVDDRLPSGNGESI